MKAPNILLFSLIFISYKKLKTVHFFKFFKLTSPIVCLVWPVLLSGWAGPCECPVVAAPGPGQWPAIAGCGLGTPHWVSARQPAPTGQPHTAFRSLRSSGILVSCYPTLTLLTRDTAALDITEHDSNHF